MNPHARNSTPSMHDAPDTLPPGPATATAANAVARQSLFLGFFGFMLVALNCLVDNAALDVTLIPRLLAVLAFLLVSVVIVSVPRISRLLDFSVLGEPVIPLFAGYVLVTCGSLLVAVNALPLLPAAANRAAVAGAVAAGDRRGRARRSLGGVLRDQP